MDGRLTDALLDCEKRILWISPDVQAGKVPETIENARQEAERAVKAIAKRVANPAGGTFPCTYCGEKHPDADALAKHVRGEHFNTGADKAGNCDEDDEGNGWKRAA